MTLTKVKPRRMTSEHRKRSGMHHKHSHDYVKTYWPYLPVLAILVLGLLANSWLGRVNHSVLGYATDMSAQSLLADTNQQRADNQETSLQLNQLLMQAAQAKANDMAARNYWSHNTPDGKTPWTFIITAGYNYQAAGENLAYGFGTAADTVTGWMHSPEHRANILNANYRDVGFGIANINDYQNNGPETLVVAMYGTPVGSAITAAANTPITITQSDGSPVVKADTVEPGQQPISRLQLVASDVPMNIFALAVLGTAAAILLIIRHSLAWRKALLYGEVFVLRHPALDIFAITLVSMTVVLGHTVGLIR